MSNLRTALCLFILSLLSASCLNDAQENLRPDQDQLLFEEVQSTSSRTFYLNSQQMLESSPVSGHTEFYRVWYNDIAAAALDDNGFLPEDATMPTGALVVKESGTSASLTDRNLYAVMKKDPTNPNAAEGWIWAYYQLDGRPTLSTSENGGFCLGCHSIEHRDFLRLWDAE